MKARIQARTTELKDRTFEDMQQFVVTQFIEETLGGKQSLFSTAHFIVDVCSRWGWERALNQKQNKKHKHE